MSEKEIKKILDENKVLKEENKRLWLLVAYIKKTIQEYEDGIVQFHNAVDAEKQAALRQAYLEADKGIVGKLMIKVDDLPISGRTKSAFRSSKTSALVRTVGRNMSLFMRGTLSGSHGTRST